ncbi:MAG TPA: hypothetical protein VFN21_02620 [Acidimicrobiales bacterium]|nr:hypothetical protein [Acidimicrobiales bacterium]
MRCETLDRRLSATFEDPSSFRGDLEVHVAECLRCQAELARYRRLRFELANLRSEPAIDADGLLEDIFGTLDASTQARLLARRGRQALCTLVAAAGAAGAIVVVGRVRSRRLAG